MPSLRIPITAQQHDYLEQLVRIGCYGETVEEAALWMIRNGLSDRIASGLIKPVAKASRRAR